MPLPITKPQEIQQPNAIYVPQIILQTSIYDGRLVPSAIINLMPAKCVDGVWTETGGQVRTIHIQDVTNLDEDLTSLQEQSNQLFGGFVEIIGAINAIRQVL